MDIEYEHKKLFHFPEVDDKLLRLLDKLLLLVCILGLIAAVIHR